MDTNLIMQAISTVGFPIVMCGVLVWYMAKQSEQHKTQIEKMTEALNNNTLALTKLELKIGEKDNRG